ncbi:hypothetical protein BP6252_11492 [Coleophoma cylindrospora]|uniref:DUF1479-domain-containing protein n=1 Tax=Coleophoma cylindrospora TaxID=1849047 RepID=A0A3D8QJV6_9HELO|nr:hypothetical protein BP6252_11492 [Coleophoma cylindrospora]
MAAVQKPMVDEPIFGFARDYTAPQTTTDRSARKQKVVNAGAWADTRGAKPKPLDARFADVKKRLVKPAHYAALQASWHRLLQAIDERVNVIEAAGPDFIPTVEFAEITPQGQFPEGFARQARERGCCVVKNVVSETQARDWKAAMVDYCAQHPDIKGTPPAAPQIWKAYWTPAQVEARSHPAMLACQRAMSRLYHAGDEVDVDLDSQAMYADRFRVRPAGVENILPPHLDNGSIERWEDEAGYSSVFTAIWEGRWEDYDAWDMTHRADAVTDLYGGPGWLSLSNNGPNKGTIQLLPDIKLSTAYLLLRPFFTDDGQLDMESTYFYGADPGMGQVLSTAWHPHLQLDRSIVSIPNIAPGSYVFWHCDMVHKVEEKHEGSEDSSVAYIPVVPLCKYNIGNLVEQRKAFLAGNPPPDMPPLPEEGVESDHADRGRPEHILTAEGRRMLGLEAFDALADGLTPGQKRMRELANRELGF